MTHEPVRFRPARVTHAGPIAALHTDSWRRHYRGVFADAYLDGEVAADHKAQWAQRLRAPDDGTAFTHVAEQNGELVGFVHTILHHDPTYGALLDNLHVAHTRQRDGIGAQLIAHSAASVLTYAPREGLYLWVLERNHRARAFYDALGGTCVERTAVSPPGDDPARLTGEPRQLRYAWPDPGTAVRPANDGVLATLPTDLVARYRAVDRELIGSPIVDTPSHLDALTESVRARGITVPLRMGFSDDFAFLDGNHRIAVALRLGLDVVPVELVRASHRPAHAHPMSPADLSVIQAAYRS